METSNLYLLDHIAPFSLEKKTETVKKKAKSAHSAGLVSAASI